MKCKFKIPATITFLFWMVFVMTGLAQQVYTLTGEPRLVVSGTSSLHDWDMVSNKAKGTARLTVVNSKITEIDKAEFSMEAKALKSGRGQMDNNAYKALDVDKNPMITFTLKEANHNGSGWIINGNLQIAGITKTVAFELATEAENGMVNLSGETSFKLTDFKVDPPTAVFGTIKTGNEVTLNIEMNLKQLN